jgi:hypothetical protein
MADARADARTGIEIEFDTHSLLESWFGPTSQHEHLRFTEVEVILDGTRSIVAGEKAHFFPAAAGRHELEVHLRPNNAPLDRFAHLPPGVSASATVDVHAGEVTRVRYHTTGGIPFGKASLAVLT